MHKTNASLFSIQLGINLLSTSLHTPALPRLPQNLDAAGVESRYLLIYALGI